MMNFKTLYDKAVSSGAFTVSNSGTKRIDILKALEIPEVLERLKQVLLEV